MAIEYRDYGTIGVNQIAPKVPVDTTRRGQVYEATHTGEGDSLPFLDKAYISFTYGGKKIEDFDLLAVTAGDRLQRNAYSTFEDLTTDYSVLDGQFYWGSRYQPNELTLNLFTDGITYDKLEDFRHWFRPGEFRELILAEHPNRGIMARIKETPRISMLPFREKRTKVINGQEYEITIGLYKGSIELTFVMDDPFWYAINNVLGQVVQDEGGHAKLQDKWIDANGKMTNELTPEMLKIVVEDMIPLGSMITQTVSIGGEVMLAPSKRWKYTLSDKQNVQKLNEFNKPVVGTPLVNNEKDDIYLETGAIVGPIYYLQYGDNAQLTKIPNSYFKMHWAPDDNNPGRLQYLQGQNQSDTQTASLAMVHKLAIKAGSTITCTDSKYNVDILTYDINDGSTYKGSSTISTEIEKWECEEDCQIYFFISSRKQDKKIVREEGEFPWKTVLNSFEFNLILSSQAYYTLKKGDQLNYFYSGTAPSFPTIQFSVPIKFDDDGYIVTFADEHKLSENGNKYNTLCLEGAEKHELRITNLNVFSAYNSVIKRLKNLKPNEMPIVDAIDAFRLEIAHPVVRDWIIGCINIYKNNYNNRSGISSEDKITTISKEMQDVLLSWMPYLFVSLKQSGITKKTDEPHEVNQVKLIDGISLNYEALYYKRLSKENETPIVLGVALNQTFKIIVSANNASTFQWQYTDKNIEGNDWFRLNNSNFLHGANTSQLTISQVQSNVFNYKFRCMISNAKDTKFTPEIEFKEQDLSLDIELTGNSQTIDVTELSQVTLQWYAPNAIQLSDNNYAILMYRTSQDEEFTPLKDASDTDKKNFKTQKENPLYSVEYNEITSQMTVKFQISEQATINKWQFTIYIENQIQEKLTGDSNSAYTLQGHYIHSIDPTITRVYTEKKQGEKTINNIMESETTQIKFFNQIYDSIDIAITLEFNSDIISYINFSTSAWLTNSDETVSTAWSQSKISLKNQVTPICELPLITKQGLNDAFIINLILPLKYKLTNIEGFSKEIIIPAFSVVFPSPGEARPLKIIYASNQINKLVGESCKLMFSWQTEMPPNTQYKWQKKSNDQSGSWIDQDIWQTLPQNANDAAKVFSSITSNDAGQYRVLLERTGYSYDSQQSWITLNVAPAPTLLFNKLQSPWEEEGENNWIQLYEDQLSVASAVISINSTNAINIQLHRKVDKQDTVVTLTNNQYEEKTLSDLKKGIIFYCKYTDQFELQLHTTENFQIRAELEFNAALSPQDGIQSWEFKWPRLQNYDSNKMGSLNTNLNLGKKVGKTPSLSDEMIEDEKILCQIMTSIDEKTIKCTFTGMAGKQKYVASEDGYGWTVDDCSIVNKLLQELYSSQAGATYKSIFQLSNPSKNLMVEPSFFSPVPSLYTVNCQICYYDKNNTRLASQQLLSKMNLFQGQTDAIKNSCTKVVFELLPQRSANAKWAATEMKYYWTPITAGDNAIQIDAEKMDNKYTYTLKFEYANSTLLTVQPRVQKMLSKGNNGALLINTILKRPDISQEIYISVDCATGQYNAHYNYNKILWPSGLLESQDNNNICYLSSLRWEVSYPVEESVGDMILFNQLAFTERNHFDEKTGKLVPWSQKDKTACHKLTYDGNTPLNNFKISYKNYYL